MTICNEGRGDFCWGGEGEAAFLESRHNSQQSPSTPVSLPAILHSNQLCISVHGSYASPRIANEKMDTLKKFFFATFFKQTFACNNSYLVLAVHQMKDSYRNLDYGRIYTDTRKNKRKKGKAN